MRSDLVFQYYLVLFFDLLGQRELLRGITNIPTTPEERTPFLDKIRQSYGRVIALRDSFESLFKTAEAYRPRAELVPPQLRDQFLEAMTFPETKYYGISDSLVIAVPLGGQDENSRGMNGVYQALVAAAGMMVIMLAGRVVFRAGMDVGVGAPIEGREIYGPCLERAVWLEERVAEYPRIVVGGELINYLTSISQQTSQTKLGEIAREIAQRGLKTIMRDANGVPMLDFLGDTVKESVGRAINSQIVQQAYDFVMAELRRFQQEGNDKLAARYSRLLKYMDERRTLWGVVSRP
jgi:hypothetical protein